MIIVMQSRASAEQVAAVVARVEALGYRPHLSKGEETTIIGVIGDDRPIDPAHFEMLDGVEKTVPILKPFKLASRTMHPPDTLVPLNGMKVGGPQLAIIAGPCAVESRTQLLEVAHAVKEAGATALRGGAFKPRSSPYSFQGLGEAGLELLAEARAETGLPVVTEAVTAEPPARAARELGWTDTALMCLAEMDADHGLPRCIRVLIHWNTPKAMAEVRHVYLHEAAQLRPDRANSPR